MDEDEINNKQTSYCRERILLTANPDVYDTSNECLSAKKIKHPNRALRILSRIVFLYMTRIITENEWKIRVNLFKFKENVKWNQLKTMKTHIKSTSQARQPSQPAQPTTAAHRPPGPVLGHPGAFFNLGFIRNLSRIYPGFMQLGWLGLAGWADWGGCCTDLVVSKVDRYVISRS